MKVEYDAQMDTLTITLREVRVKESDEIRPGVIADFGYDGGVVGFEILGASRVVEQTGSSRSTVSVKAKIRVEAQVEAFVKSLVSSCGH